MQHEQHDLDRDDFAEVWRSAQHRRSKDVSLWFTSIFKRRSRLRLSTTFADLLLRSFKRGGETLALSGKGRTAFKRAGTKGERSGR